MTEEAEKDVWTAAPSLWIGFRTYFWSFVFSIMFLVATIFHVAAWFGILLVVAIVILRVFRIKSIKYELTTQRLRIISGIFARRIVEIELFRVRDLSMEQGFFQRLLGIGTIKAVSTDEDVEDIFLNGVKGVLKVKENLRKYVMQTRKATGTRDLDIASIR